MPITDQPILALVNLADASTTTLSANSEASASLGATNLAESDLARRIYRSAGLTGPTPAIKVDFGAASTFQLVALDYVNWREATSVGITVSADDMSYSAPSGSISQGGTEDSWPQSAQVHNRHLSLLSASELKQYLLIGLGDGTLPAGFFEAARLWTGPILQPALGFEYGGKGDGVTDYGYVSRSIHGPGFPMVGGRARKTRARFNWLDEDEADQIHDELLVQHGVTGEFILIPNPSEPAKWWRTVRWGRLVDLGEVTPDDYGKWGFDFTIEENIRC